MQLATFYRSVGGDYNPLFLQMPAQSIAFIYKSLGCLHSIQPNPSDDGYTAPSIPALKPAGFVTWQTIQLLLGPHEHIPFMQRALQVYDVRDPEDGKPFPKDLPKEAFPSRPDAHMVAWHAGVSERLRIEAQAAESGRLSDDRRHSRASSIDVSTDGSTDERADAAHYFSNPFNKDPDGRPAIVRAITNAVPKSMVNGGLLVGNTVRNIASPFLWSKRRTSSSSPEPEKPRSHRYSNEDADSTPTEKSSPKRDNQRHHHRDHSKHSPRRSGNGRASNSTETDPDSPVLRYHSLKVRRHKSYDPPQSPKEYFGAYNGYHGPVPNSLPKESQYSQSAQQKPQQQQYGPRRPSRDNRNRDRSHSQSRHTSNHTSPPQTSQSQSQHSTSPPIPTNAFGPSESPPFAVKVAHIQQQQGPGGAQDRRARFNDDPTTRRVAAEPLQNQVPPPHSQQSQQPSSINNQSQRQNTLRPSQQSQSQPQYRSSAPTQAQQKQWHPQAPAYAYARTPSYQQNRHPQLQFQAQPQNGNQHLQGPGLWSQGLWAPAGGRGDSGGEPHVVQGSGGGNGGGGERGGGGSQRKSNAVNGNGSGNNNMIAVNGVGGRQYPGF